ncbi:MAG: NlpC/P60 family protein [Eubacteriales bacterium]|nr:NlpC/P60 family protein [Eubacteriales bacterium]
MSRFLRCLLSSVVPVVLAFCLAAGAPLSMLLAEAAVPAEPSKAVSAPGAAGNTLITGDPSGTAARVLQAGKLERSGSRLRYRRSNGTYLKNGWRTVNGKKYYFDGSGYAVTGFRIIGKRGCIFSAEGVLLRGWIHYMDHWYYGGSSGRLKTGWRKIHGKHYYLSPEKYYRLTGLQTIGKKQYYFDSNGVQIRKNQYINGEYYRFHKDGSIASIGKKDPSKNKGQQVVDYALKFVGNPYKWGGSSLTDGADCSGFVMAVYAHFGISLPHYDAAIRQCGREVGSLSSALPGDVICYNGHVAIYMGDNKIVHAADYKYGICIGYNAAFMKILSIRRFF